MSGSAVDVGKAVLVYDMPGKTGDQEMQCPVCSRQAENLTPCTLDGVVVGCGQCGDYRISGGALHELMALHVEKRAAALAAAKVSSQYGWPLISSACMRSR